MLECGQMISGLFLAMFLKASIGYEMFFQQAKMDLIVPVSKDSNNQLLDKNPLINLKVLDMSLTSNETIKFALEENIKFLHIDQMTGQLWFKHSSWTKDKTSIVNLVVSAEKSDGEVARMTMNIKFVLYDDVKEFCEKFLCFYESITYHAIEDFNDSYKAHEIGELAPKLNGRFCRKYQLDYKLMNASDFVSIRNNRLWTKAPLNHEMMLPGPELKVAVQCIVKMGNVVQLSTRTFNITIIDTNDNLIKVQANHKMTNLTLDSPYFVQDTFVRPHSFIVFVDDDTSIANDNIEFHILNDNAEIFDKTCTRTEIEHQMKQSTVFYCNLRFTRSGHFTSSPYCVILQARETIRNKVMNENATVCISSNQSQIHEAEYLPQPMKLRANENRNRKSRKYTSNPASLDEIKVSNAQTMQIDYPDFIEIYQNASFMSRVVEPNQVILDNKIIFKILKDPLDIFNITRTAGIVYVQNATQLASKLPAIYTIDIGWNNNHTKTIKIIIIKSNGTCGESMDIMENFCSRFEFQDDCEASCGVGSKSGRCVWRSYNGTGHSSDIFATCTPDIVSCSNGRCDSLEKLARRNGIQLCPQDCTENLYGVPHTQKMGISMAPSDLVCSCDIHEHCICHIPRRVTTTIPSFVETPITSYMEHNEINYTEPEPMSPLLAVARSAGGKQCGTGCLFLMAGCPTLLIVIIIALITMRRRYVKKVKKRMMLNGPTIRYRNSNDTEIININILGEIQKEHYQQTYQKFDFDAKWEFDRTKLIMDTTLGEGEFGKVLKSYASDLDGDDTITTVAVKTVKSGNNSVELLALLSEFQLLQEVSHPNVIKLLGACIKSEPPLIIIEYCRYGSLRSYLRLTRKLEESSDLNIDGVEPVTATDVLSFAWQICKGMAYLAEMKLVHRDLAARNVLLAEGKICKVSDFGLTRDVYEDDAYLKKSKDRVPVKWMSPESLADHVYTTKTDVWSFGIVGWELITLGATPYPGIQPQSLYHLLRSGYRMERPENCSPEIYTLFEACWADDPMKRPSFKILASKFERLLGKSAKYIEMSDVDDGAISNPMYLSNVDEITTLESKEEKCEKSEIDIEEERERLDQLWVPPKFKTDESKVDNKKYLLKYDDQLQLMLARYDRPKALCEARSISQKLRYQNCATLMPRNSYINSSQPDLLGDDDHRKLIETRYDTPKMKRIRSYVEMRDLSRTRKASQSTTHDSFDDNNNVDNMPCNRTTINENLNFNDLDKLMDAKNVDKDITFKFSSLNNLNQRMTMNETQC